MSDGFFLEEYVPYSRCIFRRPRHESESGAPGATMTKPAPELAEGKAAANSEPSAFPVCPADPAVPLLPANVFRPDGTVDIQEVITGVVCRLLDFIEHLLEPYPDMLALVRQGTNAEFAPA